MKTVTIDAHKLSSLKRGIQIAQDILHLVRNGTPPVQVQKYLEICLDALESGLVETTKTTETAEITEFKYKELLFHAEKCREKIQELLQVDTDRSPHGCHHTQQGG